MNLLEKRVTSEKASKSDQGIGDARRDIVAGTRRIIAREGLSAATLRAVAREIGSTTGRIMHYYLDKDELISEALSGSFESWIVSVEQAMEHPDPWEGLRQLFIGTLPINEENISVTRLWVGTVLQIDRNSALWAVYQKQYGDLRARITALIQKGQNVNRVKPDLDAAAEADLLCALSDGLGIGYVGEPLRFTPERLVSLMSKKLVDLRQG